MTTWQTIFGVDDPIRGSTSEFATARDTFGTMRDDAQNVVDQFQNFTDPGFAEDNLNDAPGTLLTEMLSTVDDGIHVLPRVAGEARDILSDHYDRLVELQDEADSALARARTAWERKNELLDQQSGLQSQIDGLNNQIDNAAADADTSTLDTDLSGAESSLTSVSAELDSVQATLDGIYGNEDSDYNGLRSAENSRNDTTTDELDSIDLGALEDPGFWDKVGDVLGSIGDFFAGILESLANLVEAFCSGDWATFFWELKNLLDAALLILGTIALFTGIGGPLGLLLIGLSVASLALNTGLYLTQTPNPQTGETVGLLDVGMSAVSVVFAGATVFQTARMTTVFNRGIQGVGQRAGQVQSQWSTVQRSWYETFRIANAPGLRNGALPQFLGNLGRSTNNGMTAAYNVFNRSNPIPYRFPSGTTFLSPFRGANHQPWFATTAGSVASWEVVSTPITSDGLDFGAYGDKLEGGLEAVDYFTPGDLGFYEPGAGTVCSMSSSPPDTYVVPADR